MNSRNLINKLYENNDLNKEELLHIIKSFNNEDLFYLMEKAVLTRNKYYGNKVYFRGLIELTNCCKNDCYYCGIRRSNLNSSRYRLELEDILDSCQRGYDIGYRTFVIQGGEDNYFTDEKLVDIIASIKSTYPDCAITLSLGEKSKESYKKFFDAGADRYLLRHESATESHYSKLHPNNLTLSNRINCLKDLKDIGYQVGAGFMVDSPYQTNKNLVNDLLFLKEFNPHMVGIGPFIPHHDTNFKDFKQGSLRNTLLMLSLTRLLLPKVLLPATTALATISENGYELGLDAGCNVIMPNLTPTEARSKYLLYDNKIKAIDEASKHKDVLKTRVENANCIIDLSRGDSITWAR